MKRGERTRDIIDVKITTEETRHIIEMDTCEQCRRTCEAENDLPKKGSYSKNVVGTIAELRAVQMTDSNMALFIKNVFEIPMAKPTILNVQKRRAWKLAHRTFTKRWQKAAMPAWMKHPYHSTGQPCGSG